MSAYQQQQQQRASAYNRQAMSNSSFGSAARSRDDDSQGRFSRLRNAVGLGPKEEVRDTEMTMAAPHYSKGVVMDVIPQKEVPRTELGRHFPNAARRMREFRDAPKPAKAKSNVIGNLKDSIFGVKEGSVVKGERNEDGSKVRITPEDALLWRRLQLRALDKERQAKGAQRSAQILRGRKDELHARNKAWKQRVDEIKGNEARDFKENKAHIKAHVEEAAARRRAMLDDRVHRLAYRDKVRTMKVQKMQAGRKVEQKFVKKHMNDHI